MWRSSVSVAECHSCHVYSSGVQLGPGGPAGGVDPMPSEESPICRNHCGTVVISPEKTAAASRRRATETVHGSCGRPAYPGVSRTVSLHSTVATSDPLTVTTNAGPPRFSKVTSGGNPKLPDGEGIGVGEQAAASSAAQIKANALKDRLISVSDAECHVARSAIRDHKPSLRPSVGAALEPGRSSASHL